MIKVYQESDFINSKKRKRIALGIFFAVSAVYLILNAIVYVYFLLQPYDTPKKIPLLCIHGVLALIYVLFCFIFMEIKYKRIRNYDKTLFYIKNGIKEEYEGEFIQFIADEGTKDGIEYNTLVIKEWNKYKSDYFERRVLIDKDKSLENISPGDKIKFITQGNVLVEYQREE